MSDVYKTTEPLMCGDDYVFPPTVMSQVKLDEDLTKDAGAVVVRNDRDVLTLEEIQASSPEMLAGKVASAEAFSELNNELSELAIISTGVTPNNSISWRAIEPVVVLPKPKTGYAILTAFNASGGRIKNVYVNSNGVLYHTGDPLDAGLGWEINGAYLKKS